MTSLPPLAIILEAADEHQLLEATEPKRKKAKRTKAQILAGQDHTKAMWDDIEALRQHYRKSVHDLASRHSRSLEWIATQLYSASRLTKPNERKESLFNAVLHDRAINSSMKGREALPALTKSEAMTSSWKDISPEEQERLLQQLRDSKTTKEEHKVAKVSHAHTGNDIEVTLLLINAEFMSLSHRTGCHMFYAVTRSCTTDNFGCRSFATPEFSVACDCLFKSTPDEMTFKVDAFITAGLSRVLRLSGQNKPMRAKSEIHSLILSGLQKCLVEQRDCRPEKVPQSMSYVEHEALICQWSVQLIGWTEPKINNPSTITTSIALNRLLNALRNGDCHWSVLSQEEWDSRVTAWDEARAAGQMKQRATWKDAGVSKKRKRGEGTAYKSAETIDDSDDSAGHASDA